MTLQGAGLNPILPSLMVHKGQEDVFEGLGMFRFALLDERDISSNEYFVSTSGILIHTQMHRRVRHMVGRCQVESIYVITL